MMHHLRTTSLAVMTLLCFVAPAGGAGVFTFAPITGDADSGISPAKTYTHAVDFSANSDPGTTINGVPFHVGRATGPNYTSTGIANFIPGYNFPNRSVPGGSNTLADLLKDFYFSFFTAGGGNDGTQTLTLQGLTPGTTYATTFYNVGFDPTRTRVVTVSADDGGSIVFDQNFTGEGNPSVLRYRFVAPAASITYTFDPANNPDSFHQYGFTNEVVPEPAGLFAAGVVAAGLLLRRRRRA